MVQMRHSADFIVAGKDIPTSPDSEVNEGEFWAAQLIDRVVGKCTRWGTRGRQGKE